MKKTNPKGKKLKLASTLLCFAVVYLKSCSLYCNETLEGIVVSKDSRQCSSIKWEHERETHYLVLKTDEGEVVQREYSQQIPATRLRYVFNQLEEGDRVKVRKHPFFDQFKQYYPQEIPKE